MKEKVVAWQEKKLFVPQGSINYALSNNGARASASSCGEGFDASGAINGERSLFGWGKNNGWKSVPITWHPNWWGEWLRIDFAKKTEIDIIIVYGYPQMVIDAPWHSILHCQVQLLKENGEWETIKTIRHNTEDINVITFPKTGTSAIRIWVNRNHFREESGYENTFTLPDEAPRILEVEAYCLCGKPVWETIDRQKKTECGPKGNAAIFCDNEFEPCASIDIVRMKELLLEWGYGVSFLSAEELCSAQLFSAHNFSLFVHPYGSYFPVGTNLYRYLADGGHLLTFGGRAFTNARQIRENVWADIGMDPGITVSAARYIDYFRPFRDQLGIFSVPNSRLERVSRLSLNPHQSISHHPLDVSSEAEGWMSLGVVGELQPIDETRRKSIEGRLPKINHITREYINRNKDDIPLLWGDTLDENYASVFAYPCARWIPLLNSFDQQGRSRGPVVSVIPHYEGIYRGSHWIICGVENEDVLQWNGFPEMLKDAVSYIARGLVAHNLEPRYTCYYPGETASFSVIVDNLTSEHAIAKLKINVNGRKTGEVLYCDSTTIDLEACGWKRYDFACDCAEYADDFYLISAEIIVEGTVLDRLENGFVIWQQTTLSEGPNVSFHDNFFHFDGKARYVTGSRDSGLQLPWQPEENPVGWDAQYSMMHDFGMQITSPVHLDWCFPGLGWGEYDENQPIPEDILRRLDAQVLLAQKHNIIYAPCIFFNYEKIAIQKPGVSRGICRALGERYKHVPGIAFYLFDDGLRHDPEIFNGWAKDCADGFAQSGRDYLITAEIGFRQVWPDAMRRSFDNLTFASGSVFRQSVGDPVFERIVDLRPIGKSFTVAEFVRRLPAGTDEDIHGYLAPIHANFGMGFSMSMNWKWGTSYHTIWPSDVVFPGIHRIPKQHLYAFRNEALFFRMFEPVYESPPLIVVMPSAFWLKNSESYTRYIVGLLRKLIELKIEFSCIDDVNLDALPKSTKAILLPIPLELTEEAYVRIRDYTQNGGVSIVIGDIGGICVGDEGRGNLQWLNELCGVISKDDLVEYRRKSLYLDAYMDSSEVIAEGTCYRAYPWIRMGVERAHVELADTHGAPVLTKTDTGSGTAWFMNDLGLGFPNDILLRVLKQASMEPAKIEPDIPTLHCFVTTTTDGPVYSLFTYPWDVAAYSVSLQVGGSVLKTTIKDQSMCVFAFNNNLDNIYAIETQGDAGINGCGIVTTDAHIMLAAIDKKDISNSETLFLLPIGIGNVTVHTALNYVERGEFVDGSWRCYGSYSQTDGKGGIKISIAQSDLTQMFLICSKETREASVTLLESHMM